MLYTMDNSPGIATVAMSSLNAVNPKIQGVCTRSFPERPSVSVALASHLKSGSGSAFALCQGYDGSRPEDLSDGYRKARQDFVAGEGILASEAADVGRRAIGPNRFSRRVTNPY